MPSLDSITISEPSVNFRTISYNICAVTVMEPEVITLHSNFSKMSISISVADKNKWFSSALITTFDKIGIVFLLSTTL